ncbi:arabinoxylan arabinofuranohydrolase [Pedobacter sp. UYP30]|uniref:family 43 glycosylhydrolase n=1 Tax=Pedobacter sp. UYP30 TaxID=1756400 RepID=UPI00339370F4
MKRKLTKNYVLTAFVLFISVSAFAQNPDQSVINLWLNKGSKFNAPKNHNPLLPGYYADPTIIEDNGTFYIYATSDMPNWNDINKMVVWSSKDFVNWKAEYLNWPTKELCKSTTGTASGVWAPSVIKAKNGKFYMYVTIGQEIWVGIADKPTGPWKNARADNGPLVRHKEYFYVETIDAECFVDDDGQAYLYWGSSDSGRDIEGRCLGAKLNPDMVSFNGMPQDVTPPHYFEAPYMFKKNGMYYFSYSWGKTWDETYQIRYSTGPTPFGPWKEGMIRPILSTDDYDNKIKSTGHHTILKFKDKYYIVYHRFNTLDSYPISQKLRQVAADELLFNSDGSIKRVVTTHKGVPALQDVASRTNIAFESKVTSSHDLDSVITQAKYAVDENNGTLWIGGKYAEEWLQLDLGSVKSFKEIQVFPEFPIKAYQYKVELSDDQKTWKLADDKWENTKIGSPMVTDKDMKARFIRITLRNNQDNPRPGIWEVKVY